MVDLKKKTLLLFSFFSVIQWFHSATEYLKSTSCLSETCVSPVLLWLDHISKPIFCGQVLSSPDSISFSEHGGRCQRWSSVQAPLLCWFTAMCQAEYLAMNLHIDMFHRQLKSGPIASVIPESTSWRCALACGPYPPYSATESCLGCSGSYLEGKEKGFRNHLATVLMTELLFPHFSLWYRIVVSVCHFHTCM